MAKKRNLRARSAGYIKAGWIKAAQAFGGAAKGRVSEKGLAGQGEGTRATAGHLVATLTNCARGAGVVGGEAFQGAINFVAADMTEYGQRELAKKLKRHSA